MYEDQNSGLLAAIDVDDLNRVSTIYMAEELQREQFEEEEEEKMPPAKITDAESIQDAGKKSVRFTEKKESFVTTSKVKNMQPLGDEF